MEKNLQEVRTALTPFIKLKEKFSMFAGSVSTQTTYIFQFWRAYFPSNIPWRRALYTQWNLAVQWHAYRADEGGMGQ